MIEASLRVGDWANDKSDFEELGKWVDEAAYETNHRLIDILFNKYKFFTHCNSIRKYLLLGQGDFI